jgi:hypothetical protein
MAMRPDIAMPRQLQTVIKTHRRGMHLCNFLSRPT